MSKQTISNKGDAIILAGIASFTIIVVAAIWFLSGTRSGNVNSSVAAQGEMQDDMAGHHSGNDSGASTAELEALVGKPAPDFTLVDLAGKSYSNESLKGKNVILFFNEGLMCYPACWEQIVQLSSDSRLAGADVAALSVVVDPAKDWQKAIDKMPELASATVVFDTDRKVSGKFGVLTTPSSMHFGSLPGHTYVVIDKNGIVRHVYDDPRMAIHNNQLIGELAKLN